MKWLLLIHHIPLKPTYLRVKIWRRLLQVGAIPLKQSVYVLPANDQSREDLGWIVKEIMKGRGEASLSEAGFIDGVTDDQIRASFQSARRQDYEKLILDVQSLRGQWPDISLASSDELQRCRDKVARLRKRFTEIVAIDFFPVPEQESAGLLIRRMEEWLREAVCGSASTQGAVQKDGAGLAMKVWVTRENVFVDRIASAWLVRRFVDGNARFRFVRDSDQPKEAGEIRFDMFDAEYTHVGDKCTFEVMVERFGLNDPAIHDIACIVHDIDLKDNRFGLAETAGLHGILDGISASIADDMERIEQGCVMLDGLYAFLKTRKKTGGKVNAAKGKTSGNQLKENRQGLLGTARLD